MPPRKNWMAGAFANAGKGLFHRQLGVPRSEKIPETWLRVIVKTRIRKLAHNPTTIGYPYVRVTPLIKHRATLLLTADKIGDKRRRARK